MTAKTLRIWYLVRKWTSLISTIFLLMLCLTRLPLIFHEETEHYFEPHPQLKPLIAESPRIDYDDMTTRALAARPGEVVYLLVFEKDDPLGLVISTPSLVSPSENSHMQLFDARIGEFFDVLPPPGGFTCLMLELHVGLFLGLPSYLFLDLVDLLLMASSASGVVVYASSMRKLDLAMARVECSRYLKRLDLHNLLGIVTLSWALVVGMTGTTNTLALSTLTLWQGGQLAGTTAPYKDASPLQRPDSLDAALAMARRAAPGMEASFIGLSGIQFNSQRHYVMFMRGNTSLTERLLEPVLIDAQSGELTDICKMPLYMKTLLSLQPLHFDDYGGMLLKTVQALFDLVSIVILTSGLYLWLDRRKMPLEERLAEPPDGGPATEGKA